MITMLTKAVFLFSLFFIPTRIFAQESCINLLNAEINRNPPFCASYMTVDCSGLIYINSGCEQHSSFTLDKYHIRRDTVFIDRFDLHKESPFVYIRKMPTSNKFQEILFLSIEGEEFAYRYDEVKNACFAYGWDKHEKRRRLDLNSSRLKFRDGRIKILDIPLLNRIFNVPEPIWIEEGYNYEIMLNFPKVLLESCMHSVSNFTVDYLVVQEERITYPPSNESFLILNKKPGLFQ